MKRLQKSKSSTSIKAEAPSALSEAIKDMEDVPQHQASTKTRWSLLKTAMSISLERELQAEDIKVAICSLIATYCKDKTTAKFLFHACSCSAPIIKKVPGFSALKEYLLVWDFLFQSKIEDHNNVQALSFAKTEIFDIITKSITSSGGYIARAYASLKKDNISEADFLDTYREHIENEIPLLFNLDASGVAILPRLLCNMKISAYQSLTHQYTFVDPDPHSKKIFNLSILACEESMLLENILVHYGWPECKQCENNEAPTGRIENWAPVEQRPVFRSTLNSYTAF